MFACFPLVDFTLCGCVLFTLRKCDCLLHSNWLMITLIEAQTGTPHHCQERGISIHAVTTKRRVNKDCKNSSFQRFTCNEKLWSNPPICYRQHGWLMLSPFFYSCLEMFWNCRAGVAVRIKDPKAKTVHELATCSVTVWVLVEQSWNGKPGKIEPTQSARTSCCNKLQ